ncbi:MAG: dual specificity protein phosphatase family protein [Candidatus Tectomicrobia bacterium]|nr:dual specificity protein phosphatase family protein [Candidatus Tectomicrobia bacterium]
MRTECYWIEGPWPGRFAIVPRPRGGDWLEEEVRSWQHAGLDMVVSLLTPDEVADFDLSQEGEWCQAYGIELISFPIPDRGVPESREASLALIHELEHALMEGKQIAVHCRQGIGRSALLAACLLIRAGEDPETAFQHISAARGCAVPDTAAQQEWVKACTPELVTLLSRKRP